ncbi:MAG TPA: adaptor protein MecA [Bacillales bacterium]|nr:adaptor protein MecA [Bacillales bacterium]
MKIERVNENTLKFFITYMDMEKRGFDREEIWYNRERGEELFWEMMDEAHNEEEFSMEGPLWIQVQAMEKGLEIIVTKAQLSKDGSKLELPINDDKHIDIPVDEKMESLIEHMTYKKKRKLQAISAVNVDPEEDADLSFLVGFNDFEDAIQLSHRFQSERLRTSLYSFENRYYMNVVFPGDDWDEDEDLQDNQLSVLLEYGFETDLTIHRLQEYGKQIIEDHAVETLREQFPLQS